MNLDFLIGWIIIGAITGILLDSAFGGTGAGLTGSILVGVVGSVTSGWLFNLLDIKILAGMLGVILQAIVGAVVFLFFVRITRRA
jgi:uncharacterized membrane protein YeaQ/YmgE (transglycosylase-associated protein family)